MFWGSKSDKPAAKSYSEDDFKRFAESAMKMVANSNMDAKTSQTIRDKMAAAISGGYDFADTLHNVYLDYGYPGTLTFSNFWNMYRRLGIAASVVELPPDTTWSTTPTIKSSDQFEKEFEALSKRVKFWQRLKGLDTRQRVGRYAGMFMRVRDGKKPDQPLEGKFSGSGALVSMVPLYESQLKVLDINQDASSEDFEQPITYQYDGGATGDRNEKSASSFTIHASRIVVAAEDSDDGTIYGKPALESIFNTLMDIRKIIGAGGEGFYRNAAQRTVFNLNPEAASSIDTELLNQFNENFDDFIRNGMRRAMWTPGMESQTLQSELTGSKEYFDSALADVAAGAKIASSVIIGRQTGVLAGTEDSKQFLSDMQGRRLDFGNEMIEAEIDWMIKWGILPSAEYEIEWDDLLARSDDEKLDASKKMAEINKSSFDTGGSPIFEVEEIREAAGYEAEEMPEAGSEELPEIDEIDNPEED
jgi:hypothetical protein